MTCPTSTNWRARLLLAGITAVTAFAGLLTMSPPAQAFWIGFGAPFPGYYGPGPYWGYPPPYAYAPPPYPYYPPSAYYPAPAAPAPTAYTSQPAAPAASAAGTTTTSAITYTHKPAFTNSAGQTCREYQTTDGSRDVFGTACKQADGQWRVTN